MNVVPDHAPRWWATAPAPSHAAIDAVADMVPNNWAGWIVYFCEGIEAQEPDANVDLWLTD